MSEIEIKTLCEGDIDKILNFEKSLLQEIDLPEMEKEMKSWSAPWRKEALEYYLPKGWCFGFFDKNDDELRGYFLAQAFCFFRGLTQTLWLEHLEADDEDLKVKMVEVLYKTARSKHMQSLLAYRPLTYVDALKKFDAEKLEDNNYLIKTTKY